MLDCGPDPPELLFSLVENVLTYQGHRVQFATRYCVEVSIAWRIDKELFRVVPAIRCPMRRLTPVAIVIVAAGIVDVVIMVFFVLRAVLPTFRLRKFHPGILDPERAQTFVRRIAPPGSQPRRKGT